MIKNLKFEKKEEYYQFQASFNIPGVDYQKIENAILAREFGSTDIIDGDEKSWIGASIYMGGRWVYLGFNHRDGEIHLGINSTAYGDDVLDGTRDHCEADLMWPEFIQPIRKIIEILAH